jgi:hypothetical protein
MKFCLSGLPLAKDKEGLTKQVIKIWKEFKDEEHEEMIASMPRRLQAVIEAKGGPTKY